MKTQTGRWQETTYDGLERATVSFDKDTQLDAVILQDVLGNPQEHVLALRRKSGELAISRIKDAFEVQGPFPFGEGKHIALFVRGASADIIKKLPREVA